jgi:prephenate dehydratase
MASGRSPGQSPARIGYLGPEGTFSQEALRASAPGEGVEEVPLSTIHETVMAVQEGMVDRAIVPIENSIEGSVDITLDTLAIEAPEVSIVGEVVLPISHCVIVREALAPDAIEVVISHPQVIGQCATFLRTLPRARVATASSTAEAVREVAGRAGEPWAALGNRLSAQLYGARILLEDVEDHPDNQTRFVWLARREPMEEESERRLTADPEGSDPEGRGPEPEGEGSAAAERWKTSLVFWGVGARAPGWLVRCLTEFGSREVNLTRIESRPRRQGLGDYMFFADLEGGADDAPVAEAIAGLRDHCDAVRILGSYPAAPTA